MKNRITLGITLALAILSLSVKAEQEAASACNADAIIQDLHKTLSELTTYKLKTTVKLQGSSAKAEIVGRQPNRLKISMSIDSRSGPRRSKTIFDGEHQWVQQGENSDAQVLKIDLQKTTNAQRPFDTGYYMMGSGLLNGEGFPSTIQKLTSFYNLDAKCNDSEIQLEGPLIPEEFQRFAEKRNSPQSDTRYLERFKKQFSYLQISLNRSDYRVNRYSTGPSSEEDIINVNFPEVELNPTLKSNVFNYTAPEGTEPKDITDLVLNRRRTN